MRKYLRHAVRIARQRPYHVLSLFLVVAAVVVGNAILFHSANSYASGLTNANFWVDTDGGTCTRQTTAGAYVDAAACDSLQAAVAAAQPGDSIGVKLGSYGDQTITTSNTWPGVDIVADDGTTMGVLTINASWITVENATISSLSMGHVDAASVPNNVTLKNISSTNGGLIEGGTNIAWIGGTIGPHQNDDISTLGLEGIGPNCPVGGGTGCNTLSKVTLDGLHFSDITRSASCISASCSTSMINIDDGVNGVTVKNSTFDGTNDVNADIINLGDKNYGALAKNVTLENNFFGDPGAASNAFAGGNCSNKTIDVRYNTFANVGWDNSSFSGCGSELKATGNIGTHPTCIAGMTFSHNLWTNGVCGGSDTTSASVGLGGTDGFHLTAGSPAIDAGDPGDYPITDHDGNSRYADTAPDAGANEYNGTGAGSATTPANSAVPAISGTATIGSALSTTNGTWSNTPTTYRYQWQRCDSSGANCADIAGADASSYTLTNTDNGSTVRAIVIASNAAGIQSARSTASTSVSDVPPSNTALPAISGTAAVGSTLTATSGTWTGSPAYAYQWQRCDSSGANCADIAGATASTYKLVSTDSGNKVKVVVTATNGAGSTSATSAASNLVQAMLGDFNDDGVVNANDLVVLLAHWQSGSSPTQDLDSDGIVSDSDLVILLSHYVD